MKKIYKRFLFCIVILSIFAYGVYYLFIPEFKRSIIGDYAYVYVDNGELFKKSYLVKYGEEMHIEVKGESFTIYIPQHGCIESKLEVIDFTDKGVTVEKNFIKHCRMPIYDRGKDGINYDMSVLKITTEKGVKGKVVFKEKENEGEDEKSIRKEITVKIN